MATSRSVASRNGERGSEAEAERRRRQRGGERRGESRRRKKKNSQSILGPETMRGWHGLVQGEREPALGWMIETDRLVDGPMDWIG